MTINKVAAALALLGWLSLAAGTMASAQQPKPRLFDRVTGMVFTCASATGFAWTGQACDSLSATFKKRAAESKLRFVEEPVSADFRRKKRATVDGFDQDKAVRVFWNFVASKDGKISADLASNIIYEPTKKDNPNIVPGQRIPQIFYAQSVLFDPGSTYATAEKYLTLLSDTFFEVGEGKI